MKYSDFEKHIGKELGGAEEPVNVDQLLAGLDLGNMPRKSNVKPFLFWMLIPIILIGSYATFVAMDGNQSFSLNQSKKKNLSVLEGNSAQSESIQNELDNSENTKSNNVIIQKEENATNAKIHNESDLKKNTKQVQVDSPNTTNQVRKNKSIITNERSQIFYNSNEKREATEIVNDDLQSSTSSSVLSSSFVKAENTKLKEIGQKDKLLLTKSNQNELSFYKPVKNEESLSKERANVFLPSLTNRLITISELDNKSDELFTRMKINCPSFDQAHWRLALVPEVGMFAPLKTIASKSGENNQAFEERQKYEESLEGINIGLYSMLVRDKLPFYLKAGISYTRITERTDLVYNYTKLDTTIGITSVTLSDNGEVKTTVEGPIISEITLEGINRRHNYIHLFDLPVSVGYTTYVGGFDIGIEAGVKVNFMTRATGNLLTSQSDYTNLSLNEFFKNRIGLGYFGGIMIGRNFGRFGDFYLAPRFTYYPDDLSNGTNQISQKYVTMGVNVGYVYKLK